MNGNFEDFGDALIATGEASILLGKALKNPGSTIGEIVTLADGAGFGVEFCLVPRQGSDGEALPPAQDANT